MLSRRRPCLAPAIATATIAVALLVSRSARADVDRNSPIVSDSDPRLIGNYRASGQLITTAPCQTTPCEGPRAGAAGTREVPKVVAPKNGAPSLVTRVKTALTEPVDVPPLVNAAIQLPGTVSRGFFSQAADFVKDTVGFVVDTDVAIVKSVAGLSTGNLGATERAVTSSQVAQMVKGTVQNTTTTVRMASAAITDNDEALAHAALESPMFPLVMQASVEAPRIVNTIRSGTSEERAQLLTEGGELYGRLGFEATLFAVPGGGAVRAPSLAIRTSRLAETAARTSRLAETTPMRTSQIVETPQIETPKMRTDRLAAEKFGPQYWSQIQGKLDQLMKTEPGDIALRQRLMSELAEGMNVPSLASKSCLDVHGGVGGGNCAFSTYNSLDAFANGGMSSPLTYPGGSAVDSFVPATELLISRGSLVAGREAAPIGEIQGTLTKRLRDGQMALLESFSDLGGHSTLVVRLGDELYNVNNQGWAPGERLQSLVEWDQTWTRVAKDPSTIHYNVYVTDMTVGGK